MPRSPSALVLMLFGCILLTVAAHADLPNLVSGGDFEPTSGVPGVVNTGQGFDTYYSGNIGPWTVGGSGVDLILDYWNGAPPPLPPNQSVDLNGPDKGSISQSITTEAGKKYYLQFDYAGNPYYELHGGDTNVPKTMDVSAGDLSKTFSYNPPTTPQGASPPYPMNWTHWAGWFTATSTNTVLTFAGTNGGPCGPALDNVNVTVPEPGSLALLPMALCGLAFWRRSRRAAA